jgi:hypothetical protein
MNMPSTDPSSSYISPVDLFKYLIRQALPLRQNTNTEKSMSLSCARFHGNLTEADWFQHLESALADIGRQVYIIIDLELLNRDFGSPVGFPWLSAFLGFFAQMSESRTSHYVKVLLFSYGSELPFTLSSSEYSDFVIHTGVVSTRQRRARRIGTKEQSGQLRIGDTCTYVPRARLRNLGRKV